MHHHHARSHLRHPRAVHHRHHRAGQQRQDRPGRLRHHPAGPPIRHAAEWLIHHRIELLIALGVLLLLAIAVRLIIGNPRDARHRVRMLRWRIRLYLRPGPGYANILELAVRWSRLRAIRIGRRSRPSLPWWARLLLPVTCYGVRLGRAHLGRRVIAGMEDQALVIAAPRQGKSGWLADRIIDHPGAAMTTSTRTDLYENTAALRGRRGVLHVFNPEGIGGLRSTFRWNPVAGCDQPAVALQRAASFTAATESRGLHDMAFWIGKASSVLASLLHAAALDGRTMNDVYQWAHGTGDATPEQILTAHPGAAEGWLGPIRELRRPGRTADSIRMTVTRALSWYADPAVAAATSPGPGEGFDVTGFVSAANTLYLVGTGREEASIAPLFRAFAEYVHAGAAYAGSLQPHHRLDAPLLIALDEVTQICPVPLPLWMADSAGKGIVIVAVCHGLAQLEARWDKAGAQAIWDTAGLKVILGGVSDPDTLDRLSRLCGEIALRTHSRTRTEDGRRARTRHYQHVRVLPPELLRTLPEWRALILRTNLSPVIVRLRMAWRRRDYHRARRIGPAPRRAAQIPVADHPPQPLPGPVTGSEPPPDSGPGPGPLPRWLNPPDPPPPPPPAGENPPRRPRRPWEPPADDGDVR
jgi:type IV secretory pathway TraG/TraD family ATPase VirD4